MKPLLAVVEPISNFYEPAKQLGGNNATIGGFVSPLIQNILIISALAAFIVLFIAGFNFILSNGDKSKVQQSTNMITYAVLGIIIVAAAYVITKIVGTVGGFDFLNPNF